LGFRVNTCIGNRSGSTNTGNAARKFYSNAELIAIILKIPVEFIKGLRTVWEMLRSPYKLDSDKAQAKCNEVLDYYFEFFKMTDEEKAERKIDGSKAELIEVWYKIASSVHKVLVHMKQMLDKCPVPPGLCSEEAPECNNQRVRFILTKLTRKMSRLKMLIDLVNRLLLISDPHMLEYVEEKALRKRKTRPLSDEVRAMLVNPDDETLGEPIFDDFEIIEREREMFDGELMKRVELQEADEQENEELDNVEHVNKVSVQEANEQVNEEKAGNVVAGDPNIDVFEDDSDGWVTDTADIEEASDEEDITEGNQVASGSGLPRTAIPSQSVPTLSKGYDADHEDVFSTDNLSNGQDEPFFKGVPLKNEGRNVCFVNASINGTMSSEIMSSEMSPSHCLTCEFLCGLKEFIRLHPDETSDCFDFKQSFAEFYPRFKGWDQDDPHDFLMEMTGHCEKLCKLTTFVVVQKYECKGCGEITPKEDIRRCFKENIDKVTSISKIMKDSCERIDNFIEDNIKMRCGKCPSEVHQKSEKLESLPDVLIIHTNRFLVDKVSKTERKLTYNVTPSEKIVVKGKHYVLKSVITHNGKKLFAAGNHIFTDMKWNPAFRTCNDEMVYFNAVPPMKGYIYIYDSVNNDTSGVSKTEQVNAEEETVTVTSGREKRKRNKPPPSYAEIQSSDELLTGNHDSDCDDNLYSEGEDSEKEDDSQYFFDDSITESPPKKKRKGRIG
jgi:hypothetical protein